MLKQNSKIQKISIFSKIFKTNLKKKIVKFVRLRKRMNTTLSSHKKRVKYLKTVNVDKRRGKIPNIEKNTNIAIMNKRPSRLTDIVFICIF